VQHKTATPPATAEAPAATATIEGASAVPLTTATATIGAFGGSVTSAAGESVTFPPGSLSKSTLVTLEVFDGSAMPPAPAGQACVLHAINLQPEGMTFDPPAVITFPYDFADLSGSDEASLAIWVFINGSWKSLGGTIDTVNRTVSVSVPHFTVYALMQRAAPPAGEPALSEPVPAPTPTPADQTRRDGSRVVTGIPNAGAGDASGHRSLWPFILVTAIVAVGSGIFGFGFGRREG
jgi:hypothetical protein